MDNFSFGYFHLLGMFVTFGCLVTCHITLGEFSDDEYNPVAFASYTFGLLFWPLYVVIIAIVLVVLSIRNRTEESV